MHTRGNNQNNTGKKTSPMRGFMLKIAAGKAKAARLLHKKWARVALGLLITGLVMIILGWLVWSNSSLSSLSISVTTTEGATEYRLDDDDPWERVQQGMSFGQGAQLRALDGSRTSLTFADGSAVRLNGSSAVTLSKLARRDIVVQATKGDIYIRVAASDKRTFQVRAGNNTYQSSGGAFRVYTTEDRQGTEVYSGRVSMQSGTSDHAVTIQQGERYFTLNAHRPELAGRVSKLVQAELSGDDFLVWNSDLDYGAFSRDMGVLFDLEPPKLDISAPINGTTTEAPSIAIQGTTEKDAQVRINEQEIANNNGHFTTTVDLREGTNSITVRATDKAGNTMVRTLSIIRQPPLPTPVFTLSGTANGNGIDFSWVISGIALGQDFKLIASADPEPIYQARNTQAVSIDSSASTYTWQIQDSQTRHFRLCIFDGLSCTAYSNDILITAPNRKTGTQEQAADKAHPPIRTNILWVR